MKYTDLKAFQKHLKESLSLKLSPSYFLLGKDPFWQEEALKSVHKAFAYGKKGVKPDITYLLEEDLTPSKLEEALFQNSLFSIPSQGSDLKIVCVKASSKISKEVISILESYLKDLVKKEAFLNLVVSLPELSKESSLYAIAGEVGIILDIPLQKPWEKEKSAILFVQEKLQKAKKTFPLDMAALMVKQMGADLPFIESELNKLITYTWHKKEITYKDVQEITTVLPNETIWQLGDAIFKKQGALAFKIIDDLAVKESPILLLRQLRSQFQVDLEIASLIELGMEENILTTFSYLKGNLLNKHRENALFWGKIALKKALLEIDKIELLCKSGLDDASFAMEKLVYALITA